ncbi:CLUMA_CG000528, isoform A [Clunio marinus]|uniref:CLUMA_CG000528, isoform A n=1 Tax=Clunio marinus TaxID=568069 RepID=A0A1J1HFE8_9DIPT|nr:CLUMA_CG000528, isoform A [Clunio marinus]
MQLMIKQNIQKYVKFLAGSSYNNYLKCNICEKEQKLQLNLVKIKCLSPQPQKYLGANYVLISKSNFSRQHILLDLQQQERNELSLKRFLKLEQEFRRIHDNAKKRKQRKQKKILSKSELKQKSFHFFNVSFYSQCAVCDVEKKRHALRKMC